MNTVAQAVLKSARPARSPASAARSKGASQIADLMRKGVVSPGLSVPALPGYNLGYPTLLTQLPMYDFFRISAIANGKKNPDEAAQRELDFSHAKKLAVYLLKALVSAAIRKKQDRGEKVPSTYTTAERVLGAQPYQALQPIVANIRELDSEELDLKPEPILGRDGRAVAVDILLRQKHTLWVIDGQHRRRAMEMLFDFLSHVTTTRAYPNNGLFDGGHLVTDEAFALWSDCGDMARGECTVSVEIHLGLGIRQERQLFHDLNRLGKKVDTNLAFRFDQSNPLTVFIQDLIKDAQIPVAEKDPGDWALDTGALALKDIISVNAVLFLGRSNVKLAKPSNVTDEKKAMAKRFWAAVLALGHFGKPQAKMNTVAAQPVMLKALAKVLFDLAFSNRLPEGSNRKKLVEQFFQALPNVNFKHNNAVWEFYRKTPKQREDALIAGLADWLPKEGDKTKANRDLGSVSEAGHMRFGAKHNDIYPLLADMLRWSMKLPSRRAKNVKTA